jgi:DHA1 family bicyclomycin/chloramphenicol resistance-like MFS transporter
MTSTVAAARHAPSLAALVLVTGVGPLAVDTYVAALPQVQSTLDTTASVSQLTVTAFIIGLACGQLLLGPLSDSVGRRRMLLAGTAAFTLVSAACAAAPNGPTLVALRFLEGLAGGCGVALGRAVVSDFYEGDAAAARFGALMGITLFGPVIAPAIGALLLTFGDWRTVFVFLTVLGCVMTLAVLRGMPETLPAERRHGGGLRATWARMRDLVHDRDFRSPVVVQCLATAGFFVYIGGSSFVLQDELGFSQREYALCFTSNAFAMAIMSASFGALVRRVGAVRLRNAGLLLSTTAATMLTLIAVIHHAGPAPTPVVWTLLALAVAGMGWCIPGTTAIAQQAGRRYGGAASALQGGTVFVVGALATPLTGLTGHQTVLTMAILMTVLFWCAVTTWLATNRAR